MADGAKFEDREIRLLGEDLLKAAAVAPTETRAVVARGAFNIKRDAAQRISGLRHAPAYPRSITYDSHETPKSVWAEIGPDKDRRQGALGNILEFGTRKNAPRPHLAPAAEAELPKFEKAMTDLAAKALGQ